MDTIEAVEVISELFDDESCTYVIKDHIFIWRKDNRVSVLKVNTNDYHNLDILPQLFYRMSDDPNGFEHFTEFCYEWYHKEIDPPVEYTTFLCMIEVTIEEGVTDEPVIWDWSELLNLREGEDVFFHSQAKQEPHFVSGVRVRS